MSTYDQKRIDFTNACITERAMETVKHFGYNKPLGEVFTTGHNKNPFENIGFVIQTLDIDTTRKTRIVFDYDPNFAHCLLQITQSDELDTRAAT